MPAYHDSYVRHLDAISVLVRALYYTVLYTSLILLKIE